MKCDMDAAAGRPPEVYVMAHDAGHGQGKNVSNRRFGCLLQQAATKMLEDTTSASPHGGSPCLTPRITVVPRVHGQAQVCDIDFVRAVKPHSAVCGSSWGAGRSVVNNDSILREVTEAREARAAEALRAPRAGSV